MPKDNNNNTDPAYTMTRLESLQIIAHKMREKIDKKYPDKTAEEKKVLLANELVKIKSF